MRGQGGGLAVQILGGALRAETPRMNIPVSTGSNRSVVGSMSLKEEQPCTHHNVSANQECVRTESKINNGTLTS